MKHYIHKSRKNKKLSYIRLKNDMEKHLFKSSDIFTPHTQWADIVFIGKNKLIYNATIYTTSCAWHDIVSEKAWLRPLFEQSQHDSQ